MIRLLQAGDVAICPYPLEKKPGNRNVDLTCKQCSLVGQTRRGWRRQLVQGSLTVRTWPSGNRGLAGTNSRPPVRSGPLGMELDRTTLDRARRGDPRALTQLIRTHGGKVHALTCRMLAGRSRAVVEDVCQEALVKVVQGLHRFDPDGPARLSTWILTLATRTCIDHLRRERRHSEVELSDEGIGCDDVSPERVASSRELARKVERTMAALPDEQRVVLVLRAYHDLDYDEIARVLGIEIGTVKSRLGRARLALRQLMADKQGAA